MKAEELRIGNLVSYKGRFVPVAGITQNGTVIVRNPISGWRFRWPCKNELSPITISEEWLIKFGFEKLSRYEESNTEEDYVYQIEVDKSPDIFLSRVELRYVHQLQNLYYALTGIELSIKETV